ncbi:conjugal transfer protein TraO [Capnocytophaga canis]|uniref:Conjugative transposon protein TraO n=1 Tax=Capnocytophaga canis TaxID=1848903 RepID=A0A0B7ILJ3_9FLAO|nr:conjugal transfer protein TraO [Capnocytophaga canis]CEN52751.1 hypothetical protein CCAND93_290014 [Capnocytophaga canis]
MKPKYYSILIAFICGIYITNAQKKVYSFDISTGIAEDGIASSIGINWHFNKKDVMQMTFLWNIAEDYIGKYKIPYGEYTIQTGYQRKIISSKYNTINMYLGGGALFGLEYINHGKKNLHNGAEIRQQTQLIYGVYLSAVLECYLGSDLYLNAICSEYLHINSELGYFFNYLGIGIRYYIL